MPMGSSACSSSMGKKRTGCALEPVNVELGFSRCTSWPSGVRIQQLFSRWTRNLGPRYNRCLWTQTPAAGGFADYVCSPLLAGFEFFVPNGVPGAIRGPTPPIEKLALIVAATFVYMVAYSPGTHPVPSTYSVEALPLFVGNTARTSQRRRCLELIGLSGMCSGAATSLGIKFSAPSLDELANHLHAN